MGRQPRRRLIVGTARALPESRWYVHAVREVSIGELPGIVRSIDGGAQTIVGLVGPPGVGKSTVSDWLAAETVGLVVPMDGYHLDHDLLVARGDVGRKGAPFTFDAWGFARTLQRLRSRADGETVYFPRFDRTIENAIAGSVGVTDEPLVIVEGNYLLLDDEPWRLARSALDLVVYIDLAETTRLLRLMRRHVEHGRTRRAAAAHTRSSDELNARLIEESRPFADLAVSIDGFDPTSLG